MKTIEPFDHVAAGHVVPLRRYVADLHLEAEEADWNGNHRRARACEKMAADAIAAGLDPVPMF